MKSKAYDAPMRMPGGSKKKAKEITEIYLFALCPCRCGKQSLLFPTEHSKATKWFSAMSTKGNSAMGF